MGYGLIAQAGLWILPLAMADIFTGKGEKMYVWH